MPKFYILKESDRALVRGRSRLAEEDGALGEAAACRISEGCQTGPRGGDRDFPFGLTRICAKLSGSPQINIPQR